MQTTYHLLEFLFMTETISYDTANDTFDVIYIDMKPMGYMPIGFPQHTRI
jgi:hypothetical protein